MVLQGDLLKMNKQIKNLRLQKAVWKPWERFGSYTV